MTFLAMQPPGKLTGAKEIAEAEDIPMAFLWKILHTLRQRRLVRSFKGIHGGYELALPAEKITLTTILAATDGEDLTSGCVLGLPICNDQNPCPLHETWKQIRATLNHMLQQTTLADLAQIAQRRTRKRAS
ncbi:MAG: Rrf2 family transcriptional regulator [Firmicutes bacterium]|nr:Rrf2 family transcriptional regulator [Bacillota bacterium]